jgi:WD40 repeat protein/mono/diheme cytochrome c family protein
MLSFARVNSLLVVFVLASVAGAADPATPVSFVKDVQPVLQTNCLGCHQPAKSQGGFVMTAFESLLKGGESGDAAIVAKDAAKSELLARVKGADGKAIMPPAGNRKLTAEEIATIERWIVQGAANDTPPNNRPIIDEDHPPTYTRPPVVPSIDVSPDGQFIAVAGFHEVLLHNADGSAIAARLVGLSERIESVKFSPDGTLLAVAGGLPGRMGEIQVWDVAKKKLKLSLPITADTLYGVAWSPDGKSIAFGCGDTSAVRVIDAATGQQTLFQGAHSDWVLGTVFSADGSHLVSVGRDRACKLIEVATQRFVDNITSITPGALRGGLLAVARHPKRDEIVVAGADGQPKVYRMHRQSVRVIGDDGNLIRELPPLTGRAWSVAVSADGKRIVAGSGVDGQGEIGVYGYEFDTKLPDRIKKINEKVVTSRSAAENKELEAYYRDGVKQIAKASTPTTNYAVAFMPDGQHFAAAGSDGMVRVYATETAKVVKEWSAAPKVTTVAVESDLHPDYVRDVAPVLSRLGCNAGTCHGSKEGKNGFKLSLRGYDAIHDVRAFTDEHASRRTSVASPDDSLMLLKCTGAVPHVGGQLTKSGEPYYRILRAWIADGAKLDVNSPRVAKIAITPTNPVIDNPGGKQQFKVIATFADGGTRDVTKEAFLESGNTEVAKAEGNGLASALRRGEAPMLARYEGAYAATTLTVMGDRTGFAWVDPPKWNKIDDFTAGKWQRLKSLPSELCSDAEFIRRVSLDLTGLPPTADAVRAFLADQRPQQTKRDELIDKLVGSTDYVEHWTNKWADLLQVNRKFLGVEGSTTLRAWIRQQITDNVPYDRFAAGVLTASGSNRVNPPASYFKVLRQPAETMENTTHLFLAVRFNCNKCHDHPFERWTQDQYYQTAAFFAQYGLQKDPASGDKRVGGSEVESSQPLYEEVVDNQQGEVTHDRTGAVTAPAFPYLAEHIEKAGDSRRQRLAAWMTSPDNQYFAKSYVNRLWGYLFGVGIIEPIDDIRAGNPASNPELLEYLTQEFIKGGFNVRSMHRLICKSRTYQLSVATTKWNEDDKTNYSHALARRLPAEVIFDAVNRATGSTSKIPGLPPGSRAAEMSDSGVELPGGFLNTLGRPPRESACECERVTGLQLGPIMALVSGPVLNDAIADPSNTIAKLAMEQPDDGRVIEELYLRILNRTATPAEIDTARKWFTRMDADHDRLVKTLAAKEKEWSPIFVRLQEERDETINQARTVLEDYRAKEYEPRQKKLEAERQTRIAAAQTALSEYDAKADEHRTAWEKQSAKQPEWIVLKPHSIKANKKETMFKVEPDGSIFVAGGKEATLYTFTAETSLTGITGIRIEALSDDRLPARGPGRAPNGNFVLTELEMLAGTKPVKLHKGLADFSQSGFSPDQAINGQNLPRDDGWAVVPRIGEDHWCTFETTEPIGAEGGTLLTFKLNQAYVDKLHSIGRFRISVTTAKSPGLSLPDHVITALRRATEERSDEQKKLLTAYHARTDMARQQLVAGVATTMKPLPPDAKLEQLKLALAEAEKPIAIDPKLLQLRADAKLSAEQLKNKRLVAAQDVTWALINSPAFLFNR